MHWVFTYHLNPYSYNCPYITWSGESHHVPHKICNAFNSGSVPEINDFFNSASFVNVSDYTSPEVYGVVSYRVGPFGAHLHAGTWRV